MIGLHVGLWAGSRAASGAFSPLDLGPVLSWMSGDNGTASGGFYSSLADSGTLSGAYIPPGGQEPAELTSDGKSLPEFTLNRLVQHDGAASSWGALNDTSSDVTITMRFRLSAVGATDRFLTTFSEAGNQVGFATRLAAGRLRVVTGNGSAAIASPWSLATILANTWHTLQVVKTGSTYAISVDGETPVSATGNTVDASPQHALVLGNWLAGTSAIDGVIGESIIHSAALDTAGLLKMREYMADRWSGVPT